MLTVFFQVMVSLVKREKLFPEENNGFIHEMVHRIAEWHLRFSDVVLPSGESYILGIYPLVFHRGPLWEEFQKCVSSP